MGCFLQLLHRRRGRGCALLGVLELQGFVVSLCKALVHEAAKFPCLWMSFILVKCNRSGLEELKGQDEATKGMEALPWHSRAGSPVLIKAQEGEFRELWDVYLHPGSDVGFLGRLRGCFRGSSRETAAGYPVSRC